MIFEDFFKKNFNFAISQWSAALPEKSTVAIVIIYCVINLFGPLCFSSLLWRLIVSPLAAFGVLMAFLYFSGGGLAEICSFRVMKSGEGFKVVSSLLLLYVMILIGHYWSLEFFEYIGWTVEETQPLTETLKNAGLVEKIIIGIITVGLAPVGEEIVFRRMLYGVIAPYGRTKALLLSSFLFSIAHFYPAGIVGLFAMALILQLLYLHTRNLWCPIQVHVIFNALSFISVLCRH